MSELRQQASERWASHADWAAAEQDKMLYGNSYAKRDADGLLHRIDPTTISADSGSSEDERALCEPPAELFLTWCPVCGRDDRLTYLRREMQHNTPKGKRCVGKPVRVRYAPTKAEALR